jgi:hypothetical protein
MTSNRQRLRDARGTALLEFSLVVPLVLVLCLGVVEVSYALLDQHVGSAKCINGCDFNEQDIPDLRLELLLRASWKL